MKFTGFPKIPRLFRDIVITEKLDGANASVYIVNADEFNANIDYDPSYVCLASDRERDMCMFAGSRNRWVTPEKDNMGFAKWVKENSEFLFELGYGHHFGEWWGQGIQRGYGLKEKRFSLFNTRRWGNHKTPEEIQGFYDKFHCYTVPVLYEGPIIDSSSYFEIDGVKNINYYMGPLDTELTLLRDHGSVAAPGFMNPEGIIVYHKAGDHLYKVLLENDNEPKSKRETPENREKIRPEGNSD